MSENEPSKTHQERQDEMEKALNDIMKNGPKLRLGHVPAPGKRFRLFRFFGVFFNQTKN